MPMRIAPSAARMLMAASQGVPRLAERMCGYALELASIERARRIEPRMVAVAARRIGIDAPYATDRRRRMALASAGLAVCLAVAGGAWEWVEHTSRAPVAFPAVQTAAI